MLVDAVFPHAASFASSSSSCVACCGEYYMWTQKWDHCSFFVRPYEDHLSFFFPLSVSWYLTRKKMFPLGD